MLISGERGTVQDSTAWLAVERAETMVTVCLQRAHAACLGQGESVLLVAHGRRGLGRLLPCGDVAEEAQGIRLVTTFLACTGMHQRAFGEGVCLLQTASPHLGLPQGEATTRLIANHCCDHGLFQRLGEQ